MPGRERDDGGTFFFTSAAVDSWCALSVLLVSQWRRSGRSLAAGRPCSRRRRHKNRRTSHGSAVRSNSSTNVTFTDQLSLRPCPTTSRHRPVWRWTVYSNVAILDIRNQILFYLQRFRSICRHTHDIVINPNWVLRKADVTRRLSQRGNCYNLDM